MDSHHKRVLNESHQQCHAFELVLCFDSIYNDIDVSSTSVISLIKYEENRGHKR